MATAEHTPSKRRWRLIVKHPAVRLAVAIVIVVIAIFALNSLAAHVKWVDVKADLVAASSVSLLTALAFTALSFVGISFYDALAVRISSRSILARSL
ncbi:MAG: phosphatidylglycerol lysyltransferase [Marinobacter maritimus]|jgi:phosphatidylglycerol lysyltransferase